MNITNELLNITGQLQKKQKPSSSHQKQPHPKGIIISRANEAYCQLCSFRSLLISSYDAFVGYHRFIGDIVNKKSQKSLYFSEDERLKLRDEVVHFMSGIATVIQDLSSTMDDMTEKLNMTRLRFYQSILSDLMHKLNEVSKLWDYMQKEQVRIHIKPCRMFANLYQDDNQHMTQLLNMDALTISSSSATAKVDNKTETKSGSSTNKNCNTQAENANFAQRYIDEIAPPAKMREYQSIADQQRTALMRETQTLQARFSEDMLISLQLEKTVMGISSMVGEFAALLESQTPMVEDIGDVAKDVKASMKSTDEELLVTLERTQSQNWNMIILVLTLSFMLLFLHFITP